MLERHVISRRIADRRYPNINLRFVILITPMPKHGSQTDGSAEPGAGVPSGASVNFIRRASAADARQMRPVMTVLIRTTL
jgi:hypothetical protein